MARPNNLPVQVTDFIGRERELGELRQRLASTRLVTLTGAGGIGKTRLAPEAVAGLEEDFRDGVWLVELATLDPSVDMIEAVLQTLWVAQAPERQPIEALIEHFEGRELLLVLDNCEHLVQQCADTIERVVLACPRVRVLATSRRPLGLHGEVVWRVPPLSVPNPVEGAGSDEIAASDAVRLFCEHARLVQPTFVVDDRNAAAVAHVCRSLDGIPLAIELAAARTSILSVEQIAQRLGDRFGLLVSGDRNAAPRHKTLRAVLDWSYDQLTCAEQRFLCRLSVFRGGWTLEASEAVCTGGDITAEHTLDLLHTLVQESLVQADTSRAEARYRFLETIRQYAQQRLPEHEALEQLRHRHASYFVSLAARAEPELSTREQAVWLDRLEYEHENIRDALAWTLATNPRMNLRFAVSLGRFWERRGHLAEGQSELERALAAAPGDVGLRAGALIWLGELAARQGDMTAAAAAFEEAIEIRTGLQDQRGRAEALRELGVAHWCRGDLVQAKVLFDMGLELSQRQDDLVGIGWALAMRGQLARIEGEVERARALLEDALAAMRALGDVDDRRRSSLVCRRPNSRHAGSQSP